MRDKNEGRLKSGGGGGREDICHHGMSGELETISDEKEATLLESRPSCIHGAGIVRERNKRGIAVTQVQAGLASSGLSTAEAIHTARRLKGMPRSRY